MIHILLLFNNRYFQLYISYCCLIIGMGKWTSLLLINNRIDLVFFTYCYLTIGNFENTHAIVK